jgi:hypothetical protein
MCAYRPAFTQWQAKAKKVWRFVLQKLSSPKRFTFMVWQGQILQAKPGINHSVSKAVHPWLYLLHRRILT